MNQSLINVARNSVNPKVLEIADILIRNQNRRVRLTFIKDDGKPRSIIFVPAREYNETFGLPTTNVGRRIVASKCAADMITVQEITEIGKVQPRTVNLATVVGKVEIL